MKKTVSAYPKTEATFRQHLSIEDIEHDSFNRPLRQCELRQCKGMCCYDGVYVNEEEEEVIVKGSEELEPEPVVVVTPIVEEKEVEKEKDKVNENFTIVHKIRRCYNFF